eukprot:11169995-Lingulodinium_polyedra.AAC.1
MLCRPAAADLLVEAVLEEASGFLGRLVTRNCLLEGSLDRRKPSSRPARGKQRSLLANAGWKNS